MKKRRLVVRLVFFLPHFIIALGILVILFLALGRIKTKGGLQAPLAGEAPAEAKAVATETARVMQAETRSAQRPAGEEAEVRPTLPTSLERPQIPTLPPATTGLVQPFRTGESGRERKYGLRPVGVQEASEGTSPQEVSRPAASTAQVFAETPLLFDDACKNYGGDFDFFAQGAGFSIFLRPDEICAEFQRPLVHVPENERRIFTIKGEEFDACKLSRVATLCMRMPGANTAAQAVRADRDMGGITNLARFCDLIYRWHESVSTERSATRRRDKTPVDQGKGLGSNNYFLGADPAQWILGTPGSPFVQYKDIYPGIDLGYYATQNRLDFVFVVWPGADPGLIQLAFDTPGGQAVDEQGNLVFEFECGKIIQYLPIAYQIVDGIPIPVTARYELNDKAVHIWIDSYDRTRALLVRPTMDFLSFLGGTGEERAYAVAVDGEGFAYVAGETTSPAFLPSSARRPALPRSADVFVTKFRVRDALPVYTTFLGGVGEDRAFAIAVDSQGNAYICGETSSPDFPSTNAVPATAQGSGWEAFVVKLDPRGRILDLSTRFGGGADEHAYGIALDNRLRIVVAGETCSEDFPFARQIGTGKRTGDWDAFLAMFDNKGQGLLSALRFGGVGQDTAYGLAVDAKGHVVIAGETSSPDLATPNTFQARFGGGKRDAFVAKFPPDLSRVLFASYIGGENDDRALAVALDAGGNLYVAGETASRAFPVTNAVQRIHRGGQWDAFITKITPDGSRAVYSTYFGGAGEDRAFAIVPDGSGFAHVAGATSSTNLIVHRSVQETHGGGTWDSFFLTLEPAAPQISRATYLGGTSNDFLFAVSIASSREILAAGATASTNLPVVNALQTKHAGDAADILLSSFAEEMVREPELRPVLGGGQPNGPDYDFYMSKFEITNEQFVRFLNDAQANPHNLRGTNLYFDAVGNVWFNPEMRSGRDEIFSIAQSRIVYRQDLPVGNRYAVSPELAPYGGSYTNHPCTGVSWYGAVKFCNWLTLATGRGANERCYREGTNSVDWAPVTCSPTNWMRGIFAASERRAWLAYKGFRLPMDGCDGPPDLSREPLLVVSTREFARFLNDAESNRQNERGSHMFFDRRGNVWINPSLRDSARLMFTVQGSGLIYTPENPPGTRFAVNPRKPPQGTSYAEWPVQNVTCLGALKFCNWLTLTKGLSPEERCYREGTNVVDWAPVTAETNRWREGRFTSAEQKAWLALKGVRLPIRDPSVKVDWHIARAASYNPTNSYPNPFNEFYKAAAWSGTTNFPYGFGRESTTAGDANYLDETPGRIHDTTPAGFFDGSDHAGVYQTRTNENFYGIHDLSGNVSEWLTDPGRTGSLNDRACYGGSWLFNLTRVSQRFYVHPHFTDRFRGFRVVTTAMARDRLLVRVPYRVCLCGVGTGPGCGPAVAEVEELPAEFELLTLPRPEVQPQGILKKPRKPVERGDDDDDDEIIIPEESPSRL
ncbi:MAG: DUF7948 domain-containing protein [Kiritimatiellia bacterium]